MVEHVEKNALEDLDPGMHVMRLWMSALLFKLFQGVFFPEEKVLTFEVFLKISTLVLHCLLKNWCLHFSLM